MSCLTHEGRSVRPRCAAVGMIIMVTAVMTAPTTSAAAQTPADELIGTWGRKLEFPPALQGELTVRRDGGKWNAAIAGAQTSCSAEGQRIACTFSDGRGKYRGSLADARGPIEGWWLRPSGATKDRRDPGGSGGAFATLARLEPAGRNAWRGKVEPLPDSFSLYAHIYRNAGQIDGVDNGALVAVFRNPELNSLGGSSYYNVSRDGNQVTFLRELPDQPPIRHVAALEGSPRRLKLVWPDIGALELAALAPDQAVRAFPRPPGSPAYEYRRPADIGDGWTVANANDTGLDENALTQVVRSIIDTSPTMRRPALIHSLLVAHRGKLVLDEYFYGYDRDTPHDMRSAGKTFASVMLGSAMLRGVKLAPQSRIYEVMRDLAPFAKPDPRKQQITLAHLLTHASGLDCDDYDDKSLGNENTLTTQREQPDWWKYTLDLQQMHDPGTHYAYCSANTNLVGGALTRATGTWLPQFFAETVARPLQFRRWHWPTTPTDEGYQAGGSFLLPRDLLKVGQSYLDGGVWNGRRIVSEEWVQESTAQHMEITPATTGMTEEEFANNYGLGADAYAWHLSNLQAQGRTYKEYDASGNGGQLLIVVPDANLVVVFTAGNYLQGGIWGRWRHNIVADRIIPAIRR